MCFFTPNQNNGGWKSFFQNKIKRGSHYCKLVESMPYKMTCSKSHSRHGNNHSKWPHSSMETTIFEESLTFCQFFFRRETRKLTLSCTFWKTCLSSMAQFPTATPMQRTFFSWNLTIALVSLTLDSSDSWWVTSVGNFPEPEEQCKLIHNYMVSNRTKYQHEGWRC